MTKKAITELEIFVSQIFHNFFLFIFFSITLLYHIFFYTFLTHDIYPHPHPRPTTSTHFPLPTTFSYTPCTCVRTRSIGDCDTLLRMCVILISVLANVFSRLAFGEKILFHRPWNARGSHNISIQELFVHFGSFKRHILYFCASIMATITMKAFYDEALLKIAFKHCYDELQCSRCGVLIALAGRMAWPIL